MMKNTINPEMPGESKDSADNAINPSAVNNENIPADNVKKASAADNKNMPVQNVKKASAANNKKAPATNLKPAEKKKTSLFLKTLYSILVLAALIGVFYGPYYLMDQYFPASDQEEGDGHVSEELTDVKKGTYCTYKSNSLDGVPVFEHAGDTTETSLIPEGKYVQLLEACLVDGKKWAKIDYCGITGWLPMKRIAFISEDTYYISKGSTVYINTESEYGIQAFEEHSADSEAIVGNIMYGTEFTVNELKDGWGKVEADGKSCWLNMYHVGSYGIDTWMVNSLSSAAQINFREENSEDSSSIGKIPEDTILNIEEFRNGWGYTEYDGQSGWVKLHYLIPVKAD